jgi:enamine deaminase RidA (YjgF/YER057c/UK114 family)
MMDAPRTRCAASRGGDHAPAAVRLRGDLRPGDLYQRAHTGLVTTRTWAEPAAPNSCALGAKQIIAPASLNDPSARGYSHGVKTGNLLFLAGHTGTAPGLSEPMNLETQMRRAFGNLQAILLEAGGTLDDITTMTVYMTDIRYADEFTRLRAEILGRDFPASALIGVQRLVAPDALFEIQAIAVLPCR